MNSGGYPIDRSITWIVLYLCIDFARAAVYADDTLTPGIGDVSQVTSWEITNEIAGHGGDVGIVLYFMGKSMYLLDRKGQNIVPARIEDREQVDTRTIRMSIVVDSVVFCKALARQEIGGTVTLVMLLSEKDNIPDLSWERHAYVAVTYKLRRLRPKLGADLLEELTKNGATFGYTVKARKPDSDVFPRPRRY